MGESYLQIILEEPELINPAMILELSEASWP